MDSFPLDFQNYLETEHYSFQQGEVYGPYSFVCGSDPIHQLPITNLEIANKINSLIRHLQDFKYGNGLYQFWTAVNREDRCLLTTRNQPFILGWASVNGLCKFRMACKEYEFDVGNEVQEGGLGIVGRVFRHRSIETTPDVMYYTIQEYPLRDVALHCRIRSLIAVPVFEPSGLSCVGVLEFACLFPFHVHRAVKRISKVIREARLKSPIVHAVIEKAVPPTLKEIRKTLSESCKIREVHFCQAWAPCTSCNNVFNGDAGMRVLFQQSNINNAKEIFGLTNLFDISFGYHLRKGLAIAGRAFSSVMLSLCMDTTKLNIIDYPLAHFVMDSGLNGRFAICLRSNHTGDNDYVLEFFFKCSGHPYNLLYMILEDMKKYLPSFKVASGQELGEKLQIIVIDSQMSGKLDLIQIPEMIELVQHPMMHASTSGRNDVIREQPSIPHSIQEIKERASMPQPSSYAMETNVMPDFNNSNNFVQSLRERDSVYQPSIEDAMVLGRDDLIEEPNNILRICSNQASAIDAMRTERNEFGFAADMSNMDEQLDYIQSTNREMVLRCLLAQLSENLLNNRTNDADEDPNGIPNLNLQQTRTTNTMGKRCRKSGIPISLKDIQQQFGKPLQEAATSLGVSRSTFKSARGECEILWRQPRKRNSGPHAANNASNEDVPKDKVLPPSSDLSYQPPAAIGTSEMQNYMPSESTNNVDITVICADKSALKFQFSSSSGIARLKEQVVKRLSGIDFGYYSFQYNDEENDWISILCDEDLHYYLSSPTSSTKTSVTNHLKPFKLSV